MPTNVALFGSKTQLSQIDRIEAGFRELPDVVVTEQLNEADLVFVNNPPYTDIIGARSIGTLKPTAKVIFNVLDIPSHLLPPAGDFTFQKLHALNDQLRRADAVTAISEFTQGQIQHFFALPSYVVYNPIKTVSPAKRLSGERPYPYRVLMGGRLRDPNKRIQQLAIPALIMAGFNESEVAVIGGEYPGWGTDLGVASDEMLDDLYNSVDFVMSTTLNTGLELAGLEAMACGAIPIICHDLTTFGELPYPTHWGCYPSPTAIAYRLKMLIDHPQILQADRAYCHAVSEGIRTGFGGKAVAERILDVYNALTATEGGS